MIGSTKKVFVGTSKQSLRDATGQVSGGKQPRVFVGMSGGVDSSVAALLLKNDGYEVTGVYLKCWSQARLDELGVPGECPSERDAEDARRVANHLGIPFYVFDFEEEYRKRVVEYLIDGYRGGITPNPDVVCNREIKFGMFLAKALELGADYIATGHYAQVRQRSAAPSISLFEGKDKNKDQSYFLWTLTQEQLAHSLFPIGDLLKSEVRDIARKAGLPTADKKDSQGICFLGDIALADFVAKHIPDRPGDILTVDGVKVGEHRGTHLYTIGQRHGLDLGRKIQGSRKKDIEAYYVSSIDVERNIITVAEGSDHPALFRTEVMLTDVHFIDEGHSNILKNVRMTDASNDSCSAIHVLARVRYRQPLAPAKLINLKPGTYKLEFDQPVKFIAPGQSAVFYVEEGDPSASSGSKSSDFEMLGGGVITQF